jgi:hypothetical protein
MRSRGNPNWGKPNVPVPLLRTGFDQQVEKLGLHPAEYPASPQLKIWCRRNANSRYVPEYLLKLWGVYVNEKWGAGTEYMLTTRKHYYRLCPDETQHLCLGAWLYLLNRGNQRLSALGARIERRRTLTDISAGAAKTEMYPPPRMPRAVTVDETPVGSSDQGK